MRRIISLAFFCLLFVTALNVQLRAQVTQGGLEALAADGTGLGACPLKSTNVQAEISGFLSRVKVTQEFENTFTEKIEAVYIFPLPQNAAIDDMTMRIGERTVRGRIMKREEAREVYEAARSNGQIASLLDQERPNIFTQSVANILPGEKIVIEISYVETLKYEDGSYEFMFPMTVGPRYVPGSGTPEQSTAKKSNINPAYAPERAGHDISINVRVDAGVPIDAIASKTHRIESRQRAAGSYDVSLKNEKTIPNKDFVLRYDVAGKKIEDAVLVHRDNKGGYFTMILQPPDRIDAKDVTPKEIVFVLDTSGSMSGFPIEKAKESMKMALDGLNPQDTFNLITFAGDTNILFPQPVPATGENLRKAQEFLAERKGSGGTEMMKAIKAALDPTDSQQHVRIVCFMTDGYIGNEAQIIGEIQKHPNARVFSFGIGSSVNRFLLDKMADEGRGEVEYVALNDDGTAAARRFHERVRSPLLTDIALDYGGLKVADVYPKRINDLFSAKPVVIHGRFTEAGSGVIKLKGRSAGREVTREIPVNFPESEPGHDVLATLWARTRIDDLMSQDYSGAQRGGVKEDVKSTITSLGIEYRLLTQFTSFVAVEERVVTDGGQPRTIQVPVELPEGVDPNMGGGVVLASAPATLGTTINARQLKELPIQSRRSLDLSGLAPGVVNGASASVTVEVTSSADMMQTAQTGGGDKRRKVKAEILPVYKEWTEKDIAYIVTGEEKRPAGVAIKATVMPKPEFPADAKTGGPVAVEVTLDAAGGVASARAISGEQAFYAAAEKAAMGAKFELPNVGRDIVKITGTIVYEFTRDKKVEAAEQLLNAQITVKPNKYAAAVRALVERLKTGTTASPGEAKFVQNGQANVTVRLADMKPETLAALKAAGFEIVAEMASANAAVGRIAIDKITALTEIDAVIFISPQN